MLKTLVLSLALLGAGAHAAQPSDPMHDTTTTMATADTPLDHACPCLHETDCEDAARVAEETPMKLTDLNPKWVSTTDGREGVGVVFDCPGQCCTGRPEPERLHVMFENPLGGGRPFSGAGTRWQREGDTFETLTLSPSVDASGFGHWHGFVRAGHVTS